MTEMHQNVMNRIRDIEASYADLAPSPETRRLGARLECLHDVLGQMNDAPEAVCRAVNELAMGALEELQEIEREQQDAAEERRDHARHVRGMDSARIAVGLA